MNETATVNLANVAQLVECVPNFSSGRDPAILVELVSAIEAVAGTLVLDTHRDVDHNRSVITFVAQPSASVAAAVAVTRRAAELIDMRAHDGVHPRLGATDVFPFIPIRGVTMGDCVALAHAAGQRIGAELGIPVYFYEYAARRPERVKLEDVRRGGLAKLRTEIGSVDARKPDAGPASLHESAGATIVGARHFLIAFNVTLRSNDIAIAQDIARRIRGRDGGLRSLKALAFRLESRGLVQVSMNLTNFRETGLLQAFNAVAAAAQVHDVEIEGSEIVGLVPRDALDAATAAALHVSLESDLVLENRMRN